MQNYSGGLTYEEVIDLVQSDLTVGCTLPKVLPDVEIRRLIEIKALPFFYRWYTNASQKMYYFISNEAFYTEEFTKYKYITLPCEIQNINWLYEVKDRAGFSLGMNQPNMSINMGVTNQPYISSFVSTIGDIGVYKSILDSMSDVMNIFNKNTVKHTFNPLNHRLNILTHSWRDIVLEAWVNIPPEYLFKDDLFMKYIIGLSKIQMGNVLGRYDYTLQGGVKLNHTELVSQGKEEVKEVEEEIKNQGTADIMYIIKR